MNPTATQYIPGESCIHKLNPLSKLIALFLLAVILIARAMWWNHIIILCIIIIAQFVSRVSFKLVARLIWRFRFFFYITFLIHLLFSTEAELFSLWVIKPSLAGAENGILYGIRMYLLLWSSALLGWTTEPVSAAESIKKVMFPLRVIGISPEDFAMSLVLALRFIPTVYEDIRWLNYAQRSRGLSSEGSRWRQIRNIIPLVVPFFAIAIRRAEKLAIALQIHGYGLSDKRTNLNERGWSIADNLVVSVFIIITAIVIFI